MNPDVSEVKEATVNENTIEAELDVEIKKQEEKEQSIYWSKEETLLLIGWLVVLGLTALLDSISVYIGPSPREREKEERKDRGE